MSHCTGSPIAKGIAIDCLVLKLGAVLSSATGMTIHHHPATGHKEQPLFDDKRKVPSIATSLSPTSLMIHLIFVLAKFTPNILTQKNQEKSFFSFEEIKHFKTILAYNNRWLLNM